MGIMKKFKVRWFGAKNRNSVHHIIEAENKAVAYAEAVDKYKYSEYPNIELSWNWGFFEEVRRNPNHRTVKSVSKSKLTTKQERETKENLEDKLTIKQESRGSSKPIPTEQGQTADLTGIQFVPFTPSVKLGFKNMGGIATQLNKAVSAFEAKGYEFLRVDTIHVDIRPGCIMALFGKQTEYHPYEFLVFRKIDS